MEIRNIVDLIECELAAVATSNDADLVVRKIKDWTAATHLDLTLVRSFLPMEVPRSARPQAWLFCQPRRKPDSLTRIQEPITSSSPTRSRRRSNGIPTTAGALIRPRPAWAWLTGWLPASKAIDKDDLVGVSITSASTRHVSR